MATKLPSAMRAIKINGNKARLVSIPLPKLRPTYVLVKINSVALNPTDWKHISYQLSAPNSTSGCDFAGTVVEIGADVQKPLKVGDRVAGVVHGGNFSNTEDGCFAEYAVAKGDLLVKLPDSLSFDQAASFPLGVSTVGQGLFQKALKLNLPTNPTKRGESVLIHGGSTATGSLGIQFAKLAGYHVLTTCSPHNADFVRSLGADAVYNYREPDCAQKINADTKDGLKYVWDTISSEESGKLAASALSSNGAGARYGSLLQSSLPRKDVESTSTIMYTIFNDSYKKMGRDFPASQEDFNFAKEFFGITEKLLAEGKLKTHPEKVGANGLEGVLQGMQDLKNDKVSGTKLVYHVDETPAGSEEEVTL